MATIKKQYIAALVAGLALTATLTACGTPAVTADPAAKPATSEAPAVVEEEAPASDPATSDYIKPFGEVVSYQDGVSISVALVGPFAISNTGIPVGEGETPMAFKVVLTNNSDKPLEPGAMPEANSGGKPATYIADVGNPQYNNIGLFPTATVLPGQTLEWYTGFGVADPEDITLEIAPTVFDYDMAIFTTAP